MVLDPPWFLLVSDKKEDGTYWICIRELGQGWIIWLHDVVDWLEDLMEIKNNKTVWYVVVDDITDRRAAIYTECFITLEKAKDHADYVFNHLTGEEIRHRNGLYVLKTTDKDSLEGDEVYRLI